MTDVPWIDWYQSLVKPSWTLFHAAVQFFLQFREAGLETRLAIFLGLRGSVSGSVDSLFRIATDILGCDFLEQWAARRNVSTGQA